MTNGDDNNNGNNVKDKRRQQDRREIKDRRAEVRFGDVLGRRTGIERRI